MKRLQKSIAGILMCLVLLTACNQTVTKWQEKYDLGARYLSEGNYEEAILAFTAAIEIDPKQAPAYVGRGRAYVQLEETDENYGKAQVDFQQALELDKLLPDAWLCLADVLIRMGLFDLALETLQNALEALDENLQINDMLAMFDGEEITDSSGLLRGLVLYDADGRRTGFRRAIHALTIQMLRDALQSGALIALDGKDYDVGELELYDLEDVTIYGMEGTRIVSSDGMDTIFWIQNSNRITLCNLTMGHDIPSQDGCSAGVLYIYNSDVHFENCDIFGCGLAGFEADDSTVNMKNSIIRDCSENILGLYNTLADFQDCRFSGNGYSNPGLYAMGIYAQGESFPASFTRCAFENNTATYLTWEDTGTAVCSFEDCTFSGNSWGE